MKMNRLSGLVCSLTKLIAALTGLLKVIIKLIDMASNYPTLRKQGLFYCSHQNAYINLN